MPVANESAQSSAAMPPSAPAPSAAGPRSTSSPTVDPTKMGELPHVLPSDQPYGEFARPSSPHGHAGAAPSSPTEQSHGRHRPRPALACASARTHAAPRGHHAGCAPHLANPE